MNDELYCKVSVSNVDIGNRLDKFISVKCNISRNHAQQLLASQKVKLFDHVITSNSYLVKPKEVYVIHLIKDKKSYIVPNIIPLNIIYEDNDIIVINKESGMVVHPGAGTEDNTLVNALFAHCKDSLNLVSDTIRPGIVHRLDKDTSGLIVIAKNDRSHYLLSELFLNKKVVKHYIAVIWGVPKANFGIIKNNIDVKRGNREMMTVVKCGGKLAITEYKVEEVFGIASLVKCILHTGRTHQIRVHMSHMGNSIIGDQKYGKNSSKVIKYAKDNSVIRDFHRQALHACKLAFIHPIKGEYMEFNSDLPQDIKLLIEELRKLN